MKRYFIARVGVNCGEIEPEESFLFTKDISISSDVLGIAMRKANKIIDWEYEGWQSISGVSLNDVEEVSFSDFEVLKKFFKVLN